MMNLEDLVGLLNFLNLVSTSDYLLCDLKFNRCCTNVWLFFILNIIGKASKAVLPSRNLHLHRKFYLLSTYVF